MNTQFPQLKLGSTFYRNGLLLEVVALPEKDDDQLVLLDLIAGEPIKISLRALRNSYRNRPGQIEMVPRDIARTEAAQAQRRRGKGTVLRGRKPLDMRAAGLHDYLIKRCQTRVQRRYQVTYVIEEGFGVVLYRRTPRVDFTMTRPDGKVLTPWGKSLPTGVKRYQRGDPYLVRRPWLALHVDPRAVRDTALAVDYVKRIVEATVKGAS